MTTNVKKVVAMTLAMGLAFSATAIPANATSTKEQLLEKKADLKKQEEQLNKEIKALDEKMATLETSIRKNETKIEAANKEIAALTKTIRETEERMAKREEIVNNRLHSLQLSGGISSYIELLFGAESFSDFLRKLGSVTTIVDADKAILEEHRNDKILLENSKFKLEKTSKELETAKASLEKEKKELQTQSKAKEDKLRKVLGDAKNVDYQLTKEEEAALSNPSTSNASSSNNGSSSNSGVNTPAKPPTGSGSYPAVTSGAFMRPALGPVTSEFGGRWGGMHYGIDIGKRGGSVPIVAAASGRVIQSFYSSSYGNVIFISHNIDGRNYTTVYAHLESRGVSAGTTVEKGQFIGYMGNTGQSFGAHLHFEMHEGAWNGAKSNAVNPRKYINF